mmetsp:Transcript_1971/g.2316  ORF Transcript_1971/g.2316 Transcript_1971/m.2316 type:complete len:459 (-) Transcript_1971:84-1460(-)
MFDFGRKISLFILIILVLMYLIWTMDHSSYSMKIDLNASSKIDILKIKRPSVSGKLDKMKMKHPYCFSKNLFDGSKEYSIDIVRHMSPLHLVAQYKLIGKDVMANSSILYNHLCPYIQKDRYNCARNESDILEYGDNPTDWKLTLKLPNDHGYERSDRPIENGISNSSGDCNLWNLVHDIGGPVGVAESVMELQQTSHHKDDQSNLAEKDTSGRKGKNQRPYIVLIAGNSYLRQIFEAISCGWFNDVTDYRAMIGSYYCDSIECRKKKLKERGGLKYEPNEVGNITSLLEKVKTSCYMNESCTRHKSKNKFYRPGVTVPPPRQDIFGEDVSDNIAMVEFGRKIQFYFIFHPNRYNVTRLFEEKLNLDFGDVDKLIWNCIDDPDLEMKQIFKSTGVWQTRSIWPYKKFRFIQSRDIGRWFGADNPWIYDVPDTHACLPGPPDDEVNLILFLILSNAFVT